MKEYGVDLSKHNGTVDFEKIKKDGNSFVILRAGYGTEVKDPKFDEYYKAAKAVGLKVGVYWYSYALTAAQGTEEAKKCLEAIKDKTFEYPIYIDMEDADQYKKKNGMPNNAVLSSICENFCKYVEDKGYYAGIYASESWFKNQLKTVVSTNRFDLWVANWGSNDGKLNSDKSKEYRLHQFTSAYTLNNKRFDRNVCYYDYPKIIKEKGLNGYAKTSTSVNRLDTLTDEQVATEIVSGKGDWGNGDERKKKLGSRYTIIQAIVNKKLGSTSTSASSKTLKVGASVKIKKGAKDLNTKKTFASFVYNTTYIVISISGDTVIFGKGKVATGKVSKSNVTVV